jgi:RNA polymerase sigma-70 factor (ECF subfamily)
MATRAERPVRDLTDEQLLEAHVTGEAGALKELIVRYRDELVHFLTRFLGSRAAAEDVFQETFLQVHLSAETFDVSRRLKPWLFTIAANKARDFHRKHGKRTAVSLSANIGGDSDGRQFVDLMEAELPGPEAPVLDAERSRLIKSVVDSLPSHLREILLLAYFQQMSYGQIAETLEIPLGTVKSRLHTAVATFARAWEASTVEEGSRTGEDES